MKQVCAWCGTRLNGSRARSKGKVSYGICVPCASALVIDNPTLIRDFIDQIADPVALLEDNQAGSAANREACALLHKELALLESNSRGESLECTHAQRRRR